jgi:hypothetical protein
METQLLMPVKKNCLLKERKLKSKVITGLAVASAVTKVRSNGTLKKKHGLGGIYVIYYK